MLGCSLSGRGFSPLAAGKDLENQAIKDYGTQTSATTSLGEKLKEQLEKAPESS